MLYGKDGLHINNYTLTFVVFLIGSFNMCLPVFTTGKHVSFDTAFKFLNFQFSIQFLFPLEVPNFWIPVYKLFSDSSDFL